MRETVTVTRADIENGRAGNPQACPVALALKRKYPNLLVAVGTDYIDVEGTRFHLDRRMSNFVRGFDGGELMLPCKLQMTEYDATEYDED